MKRLLIAVLTTIHLVSFSSNVLAETWQEKFARLCGATEEHMELSPAELRGLAAECEKLREEIEALGDSQNKVYLFRLDKCCKFYLYMADVKEQQAGQ